MAPGKVAGSGGRAAESRFRASPQSTTLDGKTATPGSLHDHGRSDCVSNRFAGRPMSGCPKQIRIGTTFAGRHAVGRASTRPGVAAADRSCIIPINTHNGLSGSVVLQGAILLCWRDQNAHPPLGEGGGRGFADREKRWRWQRPSLTHRACSGMHPHHQKTGTSGYAVGRGMLASRARSGLFPEVPEP